MSYVPIPLTLAASIVDINDFTYWNDSDGPGDPYVGYAFQWTVNIQVNPQFNGDWGAGFSYNEYNVQVGDWLVMTSNVPPVTVQIVAINSVAGGVINCIVEDIDRYNLFLTGSLGINPPSPASTFDALIVRLGPDGLAVFSSLLPGTVPVTTQEEINSRFRQRNYLQTHFRTYQPGNTFAIGDEISLDAYGVYSKATATGLGAFKVLGRVSDIDIPGTGWFTYEPKGKLVRYITPALPGMPGDIIYLDPDNPGLLTTTLPNNGVAVPLFIKIDSSTGVKLDEIIVGGLDNFAALAPPSVSDDVSLGYGYGSLWIDRTAQKSYINVNPGIGTALWQEIGKPTVPASKVQLGTVIIGDNINVDNQGVISVPKGAGINKVVDIPDVYSYGLAQGYVLVYNGGAQRWDAQPTLNDISLDGGEF